MTDQEIARDLKHAKFLDLFGDSEEPSAWDEMLGTSECDQLLRDMESADIIAKYNELELREMAVPQTIPEPWIDPAGGYHCGNYFSEE